MINKNMIPIIIPAYEPDKKMIELIESLRQSGISPIVIVDDGSGDVGAEYFTAAERDHGCIVLRHAVNLGKGRALKSAFNYCLNEFGNDAENQMIGVITADSDGQHTVECIKSCMKAMEEHPDELILGVRNFEGEDIPWKSSFGNKLTRKICKYLCGIDVSDTQTGLRGIPKAFMERIMSVAGERFEYETRMLIETKDFCGIREVPIKTIYDSKDSHATHFDPIRDSIKIYRIFGAIFLKFVFSSLSSCILDLLLFNCFVNLTSGWNVIYCVPVSTVAARVVSAVYNYLINYKYVFKSKNAKAVSASKYFMLAVVQMCLSAAFTTVGAKLITFIPVLFIKIVVDTVLFLISYHVQQKYIF